MTLTILVLILIALLGILGCLIAHRLDSIDADDYCRCTNRRTISVTATGVHICHQCINPLRSVKNPPYPLKTRWELLRRAVWPLSYVEEASDPVKGQKQGASARPNGGAGRQEACNPTSNNVIRLDTSKE